MKKTIGLFLLILSCISLLLSPASHATEPVTHTTNDLDIYILIGQSNMGGRAPIKPEDTQPIPHCYLLNDSNEWELASNPLNRYATFRKEMSMQRLNPGYSFAKAMLAVKPDAALGLVVNARGGTKIGEWADGMPLYEDTIRRAKLAAETGVLKGVLWHQGEGNRSDADYLDKLTDLIERLRRDLDAPGLHFVAGQIKLDGDWPINTQLLTLPDKITGTAIARTDGLSTQDEWHFDTPSMLILGERFADAMLSLE